jgi:hypothetical protein
VGHYQFHVAGIFSQFARCAGGCYGDQGHGYVFEQTGRHGAFGYDKPLINS